MSTTTLSNRAPKGIKVIGLTYEQLTASFKQVKQVKRRHSNRWPAERYYGVDFVAWALEAEKQVFGYTGVDAFGEVQRINLRCLRRWSKARKKQNLALIYSFAEAVPKDHDIYFATLTVRHPVKHTFAGQKQAIEDIRAAWAKYRVWLRTRMPDARYMRVLEAGEQNGYCHIHMVITVPVGEHRAQQITTKWVEKCRKIGNEAEIQAQNLQKCENIQNVGAYLSKYLSKSLETYDDYENARNYWNWIEICYRMGLRTVSMDAESRQYIRWKYAKLDVKGVKGEFARVSVDLDEEKEIGCYHSPLMAFLLRNGIDVNG